MRALLVLVVLLFAILFYNRPSASRQRNLAFEHRPAVTQASSAPGATDTSDGAARMSLPPTAAGKEAATVDGGKYGALKRSQIGYRAPDFSALTLDGFATRRLFDFPGRVVLLYVWATWCPRCEEEMPSIEALYHEFRGQDFVILAVESSSSADRIRRTASERGYSFEVVRDDDARTTSKNYSVPGFPYTAIIDRQGVIRAVRIGYAEEHHAKNAALIRELLAAR